MSPTRLAVYAIAALLTVFGVVFVADALVESDEERLDEIVSSLADARAGARTDRIAALAGDEPVAVVADRRRVWVEQGEGALREAIDAALPELADGAEIVARDGTITGQRARITMRLRDGADEPVDLVLELGHDEHAFSLLEVRRMR